MARTTIPSELVAINAIQGTLIADNAITAVHIATNAVSGTLIADNAVTSTHIAQNNVTATQILQNTITVTQLADDAVETAKINASAVTTAKINNGAVTADKLAANSVTSAKIVNGTIVAADLADDAVTIAKMAALARGKIIYGDSSGAPAALALGSSGTVLKSDGTDISWGAESSFNADQAQVFNESGAAVDFRIEGDTQQNLFFVDGSADRVGIGTSSPGGDLHVVGGSSNAGRIYLSDADEGTGAGDSLLIMKSGSASYIYDRDASSQLRLGAADDNDILTIDGANARVGIGTTSPSSHLHIESASSPTVRIKDTTNDCTLLAYAQDSEAIFGTYSNHTLSLYANSSAAVTILGSGNVGIGDTTPAHKLEVGGSIGLSGALELASAAMIDWANGDARILEGATNNYDLQFQTYDGSACSTKLTIQGGGNIGIGTTGPNSLLNLRTSSNASYPILIEGDIDNDGGYTGIQFGYNGSNYNKAAIHIEGTSGNVQPQMHFLVNSAASSANTDGLNDARLSILNDGKVGINNSSPGAKLDIIGSGYEDIRLGSNRTDNTNKTAGITSYMYTNNTVSLFQIFNQNGNNAMYYGSADGAHRGLQNHYWYVNAGYNATTDHRLAMQMNSSGGILMKSSHQGDTIGNLNVSSQFGSSPNTSENALIIVQNGGQKVQMMAWAGLGARLGTRTSGWDSNSGGNCYMTGQDATCLVLKSDGVAYLANGSTAVTSDERLKKNITDMADGQLAKINALKVRHFEWKDSRKSGTQTGVIAQEVATVDTDLVTETEFAPDPDDKSRDFDGDVKIVKYGDINMKLLKAVQELSAELDATKARIKTLEDA